MRASWRGYKSGVEGGEGAVRLCGGVATEVGLLIRRGEGGRVRGEVWRRRRERRREGAREGAVRGQQEPDRGAESGSEPVPRVSAGQAW